MLADTASSMTEDGSFEYTVGDSIRVVTIVNV